MALTPAVLTAIFLAGAGIGAGVALAYLDRIQAWMLRRRERE
jgi:hypothetical protein